jgi:hypothetical protein
MEDFDTLSQLGGQRFWVAPATSAVYDKWASKSNFYTTVAAAYAATVTNRNDVIMLSPDQHTVTEMLTVSKNRCHFIGADFSGRHFGQSAKIYLGTTGAATDIGAVKVTGVRNTFSNIKFYSDCVVAESLYCLVDGGEYTVYKNCEIYKSTDLDVAGASELVANGDSSTFIGCTIGSLADFKVGDIIHATIRLTKGLAGTGKVLRDNLFVDCLIWNCAGGTTGRMVYAAAANDVQRMLMFDNCSFINAANATAVPAQAIAGAASFTVGAIVCKNSVAVNCTKLSTTTGVYITGVDTNTTGLAVQGA